MRTLTLDEKIGIKGLFAKKGISQPKLTTKEAMSIIWHSFGCPISFWAEKSAGAMWRTRAIRKCHNDA